MEVEFMIRLDKFLSEMGVGTRQEVKQYIRKGKVEVDGEIAKRPELKVDETKANVTLDGERIGYASYVYYMLNKPSGVVSATEDKREKTVIDLIKGQKRRASAKRLFLPLLWYHPTRIHAHPSIYP